MSGQQGPRWSEQGPANERSLAAPEPLYLRRQWWPHRPGWLFWQRALLTLAIAAAFCFWVVLSLAIYHQAAGDSPAGIERGVMGAVAWITATAAIANLVGYLVMRDEGKHRRHR